MDLKNNVPKQKTRTQKKQKKQNKQDQISDATYISDVVFDIVVFDKN